MAVKGAVAKQVIIEKIKQAFGADFIGVSDGKVYVTASDGAENVQIAIGLTCPKVPYTPEGQTSAFDAPVGAPDVFQPAKMDEKELANVRAIIEEFGL